MNIVFSLTGIIISIVGMQLIAKKWRFASFDNLARSTLFSFMVAIPFFWIYLLFSSILTQVLLLVVQVVATCAIMLSIIYVRFWRDPERTPVESDKVVISPADGKVIYVKKIPAETVPLISKGGKNYLLQELIGTDLNISGGLVVIGIEMNILDVHINRCPVGGDVKMIKHIPGKFLSLRKLEAPFLNTRCTTIIANQHFTLALVQISSRLVRRIDNYLHLGQYVCLGQRLGMIRFGSQVALVLPDQGGIVVEAYTGQLTQAGVTILARF